MIFVIFDLFSHLSWVLDAKTPFYTVCFYYVCVMVPTFEFLLPASLLLATLYTLWQLTRNNEFTAMRASGISLFRIMMPFLGIGVICTLLVGGIKETVGPQATHWANAFAENKFRGTVETSYHKVAYYNSITRRQWMIGEIDLQYPDRLTDVKVKQERRDGTLSEEITATKAEWVNGQWWFFDMAVQKYDPQGNPIKSPKSKDVGANAPKPMGSLTEQPSDFFSEVKSPEYLNSMELARFIASHKDLSKRTLAQKRFDLHSRLAMPWACMIVTLFAIPAWLSNIVFLTAGILMMFRLR
jgi:lipopolysaccharide export system permease protein